MSDDRAPLTRREAIGMIGAIGVVALASCSSSTPRADAPTTTSAPAAEPTSGGAEPSSCTLTPELTQGPFFLTDHPNASNLVQDRKGTPLLLSLIVLGTACTPIGHVKVDIWHCDAEGEYAGIGNGGGPPGGDGAATRGNSDTWLQGYQVADTDGAVQFATIYPGWYPGRAVHIHVKVFIGDRSVHTGQLFFPDALTDKVFANAPYRGTPDTLNAADSIYAGAGSRALLAPQRDGAGYRATAHLVVNA